MEIYVDGQQLHISGKTDVALNFASLRFSEAVADQWSTECELPNDKHNVTLLDAYGLLDRGALFNSKIRCAVSIDGTAKDGYLQVTELTENAIKCRVYINQIPFEVLDKKVADYYPHSDTVYRWDRFSPITTNIAGTDTGIIPYDYTSTDYYSNILAQWHASASVQGILSLIQTAEDITLPSVYNTLWQLASRKKVCPSNPYQVMMGSLLHGNAISDKDLELCGGQHITNDFKSGWSYADFVWNYNWTDWLHESTNEKWMQDAPKMDKITFNRHCVAHIKVYACASQVGGILIPEKNGEGLLPAAAAAVTVLTNYSWNLSDILLFDDYVEFEDGDEFTLHYSGSAQTPQRNVRYTVVIDYDDYEWDEDDYDVDLEYIPAPFGIWGIIKLQSDFVYDFVCDFAGTGDGTHSETDYSFTYFGVYTNLDRDLTVREYLTSLCWIHNQKLHLDRNELIFQSADVSEEITANLKSITPTGDKLGKKNTIGYRDSDEPLLFRIDNDFLEDEVELHTNSFTTGDELPQYSYENTYSDTAPGTQWVTDVKVSFDDLGAVIMTAVYDGNRYVLKRAPEISGLGLPQVTNAAEYEWETLHDLAGVDYAYVDGRKYMVIDGDTDTGNGITTFKALKIEGDEWCIYPSIAVIEIISGDDSITIIYSVNGFGSPVNGSWTLVGKDFSDKGYVYEGVHSVTIGKLKPGSDYQWQVTLQNECATVGEEFNVSTTNGTLTVKITSVSNITDTGATIHFEIT